MRIARFNCHAIREVTKESNLSIGAAINPTLAMINHSCDSNYGRVWRLEENLVYAYATRPIKKGKQTADTKCKLNNNLNEKPGDKSLLVLLIILLMFNLCIKVIFTRSSNFWCILPCWEKDWLFILSIYTQI